MCMIFRDTEKNRKKSLAKKIASGSTQGKGQRGVHMNLREKEQGDTDMKEDPWPPRTS